MLFRQLASSGRRSELLAGLLLVLSVLSALASVSMAGKNKGMDDIILYNGNIVMRGGKGKGKGGSIVVANSPQSSESMMPMMFGWDGMFGRRR